jgi:general secretion pathway protein F
MPAYSYEALQNDGALRKGVIEADSAKAARSQLRTQALVPLSVQALSLIHISEPTRQIH